MFLTIGDKIREARKKYDLKQIAFEPYGFSRNYISMIETNKRPLNEEGMQSIYRALCELTEFEQDYSYEAFCHSPQEQAEIWLDENTNIESISKSYKQLIQVASEYQLSKCLIKIESTIGEYYLKEHDYLKSNHHILNAIAYCIHFDENTATLYERAGVNLFRLGKYRDARSYFELALKCLSNSHRLIHKVNYDIAISYLYDDEYEKSLPWIEKAMNQDEHLSVKAAAYLIKETTLKKLGDAKGGRQVLLEYIEADFYDQYTRTAYHNLGCNYYDCGLYDEALDALNSALNYPADDLGRVLIEGLMGSIYYKLEKFETSLELFNKTKEIAIRLCNPSQIMTFFEWGIDLYWHFQRYDEIMKLLTEVNELVLQHKISKKAYSELQNKLYKIVVNHLMLKEENYVKCQDLLQIIT